MTPVHVTFSLKLSQCITTHSLADDRGTFYIYNLQVSVRSTSRQNNYLDLIQHKYKVPQKSENLKVAWVQILKLFF